MPKGITILCNAGTIPSIDMTHMSWWKITAGGGWINFFNKGLLFNILQDSKSQHIIFSDHQLVVKMMRKTYQMMLQD
jgi:hypothetical protein